jgi:hypothetical protein
MLCHVCGEPAIGQCRLCHQFYCAEHGRLFCVHCRDLQRISAQPPRPAEAQGVKPGTPEAGPAVGQCHRCGCPASRACTLCGAFFCSEHRGWRDVRIGRYTLRRPVCSRCGGAPRWLSLQLRWLIAWLLILTALGIYWLATM